MAEEEKGVIPTREAFSRIGKAVRWVEERLSGVPPTGIPVKTPMPVFVKVTGNPLTEDDEDNLIYPAVYSFYKEPPSTGGSGYWKDGESCFAHDVGDSALSVGQRYGGTVWAPHSTGGTGTLALVLVSLSSGGTCADGWTTPATGADCDVACEHTITSQECSGSTILYHSYVFSFSDLVRVCHTQTSGPAPTYVSTEPPLLSTGFLPTIVSINANPWFGVAAPSATGTQFPQIPRMTGGSPSAVPVQQGGYSPIVYDSVEKLIKSYDGATAGWQGPVKEIKASHVVVQIGGTSNSFPTIDVADMVGATAGTDGERGLVKKPLIADRFSYWKANGTWDVPTGVFPGGATGSGNYTTYENGLAVTITTEPYLTSITASTPLEIAPAGNNVRVNTQPHFGSPGPVVGATGGFPQIPLVASSGTPGGDFDPLTGYAGIAAGNKKVYVKPKGDTNWYSWPTATGSIEIEIPVSVGGTHQIWINPANCTGTGTFFGELVTQVKLLKLTMGGLVLEDPP